VNGLCEKVLELTGGRAVIEIRDPAAGEEEPPTLMKNPWFIRPFEMLISSYSLPHYNEIEPTPFFAMLFLLMFGLMFGDIGHSGLLLVTGILMWWRGKLMIRDAGVILTFCGISGVIFGAVYGSVFGYEFHELVIGERQIRFLNPLANANRVLMITVLFGVAVISLGIVLNIVNRFRRREYIAGAIDRFGIIGGIFYWGSLVVAARGIVQQKVSWLAIALLVIAPLVILFIYHPAKSIAAKLRGRHGEHDESGIAVLLIESAAESFETVLAYVANTLSFARIGAFALAHAGLSIAVYRLIDIVHEMPGGPVWTVLVFIFGTLLIVLLEGLIVAIQSLRLEYYEFFGKFYRGEGRKYDPFKLKA